MDYKKRRCHCEPASQRWCGNPFPTLGELSRGDREGKIRPFRPIWGTSPIGRGKWPSSVSRLRGTREPPSPQGKAWRCGLPHQSADWFAMTCAIRDSASIFHFLSGSPADRTESPAALGLPLPRKGAFFRPLSCFLTSDLVCAERMETYNSK